MAGSDVPCDDELRHMIRVEVAQALCEELPEMVWKISARVIVRIGERVAKEKEAAQATVGVKEEPEREKNPLPLRKGMLRERYR